LALNAEIIKSLNFKEIGDMSTRIINIYGMSCNHCKMSVEKVLSRISGIDSFSVSLEKGEAEISGDPNIDLIITEINKLGYYARLQS